MPKAKKKNVKPLDPNKPNYKQPSQHNVEKAQEKDKIKPEKIFEMMGATKSKKKKSKY
jgi:hypothetical protein